MYKNFSFIGVHIWNDIQKHINVSVSYSAFKQLTRTYYLYNKLQPEIFNNIISILLVSITVIKIQHNYVYILITLLVTMF